MDNQQELAEKLNKIAQRIETQVFERSLEREELYPDLDDIVYELFALSDELTFESKQRQGSEVPAFCLFCGEKFHFSLGHSCGSLKLRGDYVSNNAPR
jgi:hypothetical protein